MQYFIRYKEYLSERPFDPSLLVTFRKRLPEKVMNQIIERSFIEASEKDYTDDNDKDDKGGANSPRARGQFRDISKRNTEQGDTNH